MAQKRPSIPLTIKLKLWVLSGGRCEFPGCNKYVWRDGLTLKDDNFAHMAHLVGASKDGPRGDEELSPKLVTDFENLMLVCLVHSKLVDGKNRGDYSVDELKKYKEAHENRIRIQTEIQPEMNTYVLRFFANIGDRKTNISLGSAQQAIQPRYPADDHGILFDYTNRPGRGDQNYWSSIYDDIINDTSLQLRASNSRGAPHHLSIFALAPIPLLVSLGHAIGNTIPADLFQRHRDSEDWVWKTENTDDTFKYSTHESISSGGKKIVLILSLSGKIQAQEVCMRFDEQPHVYEITIDTPNPNYLSQQSKLVKFKEVYRNVLTTIRERHGSDAEVHLFSAVPAPVAILCGRELLPKVDPPLIVYDYEKDQDGFIEILTINKK